MPSNDYPFIAREGWPVLLVLVICIAVSLINFSNFITLLLAVVFSLLLFLLRDPKREIPSLPLAAVSPVDATVISVDEVDDPWLSRRGLSRRAKRIELKMSTLGVYSLRSPIEGKVVEQWTESCKAENGERQFAFWTRTDEGDDITTVFRLRRPIAVYFRMYIHSGERVGQGQRCGFCYFGGNVEVLVPINARIEVAAGRKIRSGGDILGHLVHRDKASIINDNNPHGKDTIAGDAAV